MVLGWAVSGCLALIWCFLLRLGLACRGWAAVRGHAAARGAADGLRRGWPGARVCPGSSRPYVAQAGSAACGGLPRQRSTGLAGRSRGPGRAAQGVTGWCRRRIMRARPPRPRGGWSWAPAALRAVICAGQAASGLPGGEAAAGGGHRVPAGVVHGHEVDPAQQRRRRTRRGPSPGRARAARCRAACADPGRAGARPGAASSAAAMSAWYFAAMTGLWMQQRRDRPPGRGPQPGPAAPGDARRALERARGVVGRGQPGVLDQRGRGLVAAGVAGLGQDHGRAGQRSARGCPRAGPGRARRQHAPPCPPRRPPAGRGRAAGRRARRRPGGTGRAGTSPPRPGRRPARRAPPG